MRTSFSCDSCRKGKVRCIHSGEPPCQRCRRSDISGCVLTRPKGAGSKKLRDKVIAQGGHRASLPQPTTKHTASESTADLQGRDTSHLGIDDVNVHVKSLPSTVAFKVLHVFSSMFPELSILHVSTFMRNLQSSSHSAEYNSLLAAVLAVTKSQLVMHQAPCAENLLSPETYAAYVRAVLSEFILQAPKIEVVQMLLIITLYEWGSRNFHRAWVYCGIAIRIMQAIYSLRVAPYPLEPSSDTDIDRLNRLEIGIETQTYWSCFIMDCMISTGTYNPPMLPMSEMQKLRITRPLNATEFTFGPDPSSTNLDTLQATSPSLGIAQGFEALVGGFDIWAQIMTFVYNDGRKAPGMCAPHNCPWAPGSPWSKSWTRLQDWRTQQHRNLHYPTVPVATHMVLGSGETFASLNMLYYVSVLMLHREYAPFLPTPESIPKGPVDPPFLEAEAPRGWWEDSAAEIFNAAEQIALLLRDASECGLHLTTPFAGFCAFSAGYLCAYVHWFPKMNLERSTKSEERFGFCLEYLKKHREVWVVADGWIKTLQSASLLYKRASTTERYRGRSRADFGVLHHSLHEFHVVDRSEQHTKELDCADKITATGTVSNDFQSSMETGYLSGNEDDTFWNTSGLVQQFLAEVGSHIDEQGAWSQWWPPVEGYSLS